jgi:N-acyl-D-aspartate/D-glutamate deacylase
MDPVVMIASDSSCKKDEKPWTDEYSQPHREYPYPHVIGSWVRDGVLSLEEIVRKCTSLPARTLGLRDRGMIGEGMKADIVIFDKKRISDKSTKEDPYRYPEGIEYVLVNGEITKKDGKHYGNFNGRVLKY